jgi:hypothetical protein
MMYMHTFFKNVLSISLMGNGMRKAMGCNGTSQKNWLEKMRSNNYLCQVQFHLQLNFFEKMIPIT